MHAVRLPAGTALVDDDQCRASFERFISRDGARGDAAAGESRGDVVETSPSSSSSSVVAADVARVTFAASNVGGAFPDDTSFAFGAVRARTAVISQGEGDATRAEAVDAERFASSASISRVLASSDWASSTVVATTFVVMDHWTPRGEHALIGTNQGLAYHYVDWPRARLVVGLRGVRCEDATFVDDGDGGVRALVSTHDGRVFDVRIDHRAGDGRRFEKSCDVAFARSSGEAISGVRVARVGGVNGGKDRFGVILTTASQLFVLVGDYSLESVLAKARARAKDVDAVVSMPESSDASTLAVWSAPGESSSPTRMAWLTHAAVYRGALNFNADDANGVLERHGALPLPQNVKGVAAGETPASLALTEHHIFLLYPSNVLVAMSAITGDVEGVIPLPLGGAATFTCTDLATSTVYAANSGNVLRVHVDNEDANVWRAYLDQHDYERSIAACRSDVQRQCVFTAQAERMLKIKRYEDAANAYANAGAAHSVEDVAKMFIDANAPDALYAYIEGRLCGLPSDDKPRRLILAMWLLDEYVKCASATGSASKDARVREFLRQHFKDVDERETLRVLSQVHRLDDEMYFAQLCGDYDRVLDHFIQLGDGVKALEVASAPNVPQSALNRALPALIRALPKESIDFMLTRQPPTSDDVGIIKAFADDENMYSANQAQKSVLAHVARYLETITAKPDGAMRGDADAHDALLNVYVRQLEVSPTIIAMLTKYILDAVDEDTRKPYYDVHYAIQMCERYGAHRSAVYAYCVSQNFDMAMHVALTMLQDLDLAKAVTERAAALHAGRPSDDDVQKKLWIEIAKWAIQKSGALEKRVEDLNEDEQRGTIRRALSFLSEAHGVLRVEDILPLLPDFTVIDDVKELVLKSLDEHRNEIEHLKKGIDELNMYAQDIQDDIDELEEKTVVISRDEKCSECNKPVVRLRLMANADDPELLAPFYVFPCEMAFHTECLIRRSLPLLRKDERTRALALMRTLKVPLPRQLKHETKYWGEPPKAATGLSTSDAVAELEDILCADCPFCGGLDIRLIDEPLLTPEELAMDNDFGIPLGEEDGWNDVRVIKIHASDISEDARIAFEEIKLPEDWPPHEFFYDDF